MQYDFGESYYFISPYNEHKDRNNTLCRVDRTSISGLFSPKRKDFTIPVRFEDGTMIFALPEELHVSNWFYKP
jgi:hypothetical protein